MPITLEAVSSSRTDITARPVLEWIMLRITTTMASRKPKAQNQVVSFGMPIMPRPPFISGKGRMVSELIIRVFTTMVKPKSGDAEVIAAQGENRKSEQEADLGGEDAGQKHRQHVHQLQQQAASQEARCAAGAEQWAPEADSPMRQF